MSKRGSLPFMKTFEDALALCEKEQDPFYVNVFMGVQQNLWVVLG